MVGSTALFTLGAVSGHIDTTPLAELGVEETALSFPVRIEGVFSFLLGRRMEITSYNL